MDSRAVEKKSHGAGRLSLALAKSAHKLLKLCSALDLEEDLVVVVGDLDVEVLRVGGCLLARSSVFVLVGHFELVWMESMHLVRNNVSAWLEMKCRSESVARHRNNQNITLARWSLMSSWASGGDDRVMRVWPARRRAASYERVEEEIKIGRPECVCEGKKDDQVCCWWEV